MALADHPRSDRVPAPGLLILTGASHTGKTSVAQALLRVTSPPAAFLSVDEVVLGTLARPPGNAWAEIPLAYELLTQQLELLLERGWFVVFESTFTYVPERGEPEFHAEQLEAAARVAERRGIPWLLVQLAADGDVARLRAEGTGRIAPEVVAGTIRLHEEARMPSSTLRLETGEATPDELARRILAELAQRSAGA